MKTSSFGEQPHPEAIQRLPSVTSLVQKLLLSPLSLRKMQMMQELCVRNGTKSKYLSVTSQVTLWSLAMNPYGKRIIIVQRQVHFQIPMQSLMMSPSSYCMKLSLRAQPLRFVGFPSILSGSKSRMIAAEYGFTLPDITQEQPCGKDTGGGAWCVELLCPPWACSALPTCVHHPGSSLALFLQNLQMVFCPDVFLKLVSFFFFQTGFHQLQTQG